MSTNLSSKRLFFAQRMPPYNSLLETLHINIIDLCVWVQYLCRWKNTIMKFFTNKKSIVYLLTKLLFHLVVKLDWTLVIMPGTGASLSFLWSGLWWPPAVWSTGCGWLTGIFTAYTVRAGHLLHHNLKKTRNIAALRAFGCNGGADWAQKKGPFQPSQKSWKSIWKSLRKSIWTISWKYVIIICGYLFRKFCGNPFEILQKSNWYFLQTYPWKILRKFF